MKKSLEDHHDSMVNPSGVLKEEHNESKRKHGQLIALLRQIQQRTSITDMKLVLQRLMHYQYRFFTEKVRSIHLQSNICHLQYVTRFLQDANKSMTPFALRLQNLLRITNAHFDHWTLNQFYLESSSPLLSSSSPSSPSMRNHFGLLLCQIVSLPAYPIEFNLHEWLLHHRGKMIRFIDHRNRTRSAAQVRLYIAKFHPNHGLARRLELMNQIDGLNVGSTPLHWASFASVYTMYSVEEDLLAYEHHQEFEMLHTFGYSRTAIQYTILGTLGYLALFGPLERRKDAVKLFHKTYDEYTQPSRERLLLSGLKGMNKRMNESFTQKQ